MNFQDLLQQLQERLRTLWEQIQESSAYQQVIEKYEDQSPNAQKGIQIGGALLLAILLFMVPISNLFSSFTNEEEFEMKREITRELLRTTRDASQAPSIPPAPDPSTLENQLRSELQGLNLLPEQIKNISSVPTTSRLIAGPFSIGSVEVQLANLNTRQIVDVAYQLAKIHPSVKFTDLNIEASLDNPGYYHLLGKIVALKAPQNILPVAEEPEGRGKVGKARNKRPPRNEDEEAPSPPPENEE